MRAIVGSKTCVLGDAPCTGPECDLALLTVHDEAFWKGLKPISFGSLPFLQESVTVVGYPIGGENMSVTQGVVSRLDMQVGIPNRPSPCAPRQAVRAFGIDHGNARRAERLDGLGESAAPLRL
jgi:hypothetical protein